MENRKDKVLKQLEDWNIAYRLYTHPPLPTAADAIAYWKDIDAQHCKNLFFRNHKGNRHYLVVFDWKRDLPIHRIEKMLRQGKLTFASPTRMMRYLGVEPGSVSPFGLLNDTENHVILFLDNKLKEAEEISFHPNDNRYTAVISKTDFFRFLEMVGNAHVFLDIDAPEIPV
ncbi:MAG: prolyl-tRNA synthetase associated domain-containing protein [Bacteroidales bacterium]|nr:prolyl-tRNA synthetase associated domain-containing protein [Bacteroidales bacterium]MDD4030324.1 prolyl-tRNA synthetase associated domain-containing protein [Bacteroidales bacterium]MDD4434817.1 prolyl-tRNA synthetase associated domain-containing protein [Bacteroidales bacterium]MDD5732229.1 prolyl-tRNA synthetase associated domain-containing protein [Bacteroidales bacterium]